MLTRTRECVTCGRGIRWGNVVYHPGPVKNEVQKPGRHENLEKPALTLCFDCLTRERMGKRAA